MTHTWWVGVQASSLKHEFLFQSCRDGFSEGWDQKRTRFSHISCTNKEICLVVKSYTEKVREPRICWARITNKMAAFETIQMECIRKLSNFNFQCTKTLYQNNLKHVAFFFTFFESYGCNLLSVITPKTISYGSPRK